MINILIPVNKNVTPLYKFYTVFLSKIAKNLSEENINVTLLLFSDLLVENFKSHTLINGDSDLISNKSINELEREFNFSFKQILYVDLMQTSKFINNTMWRNWYLPDVELSERKIHKNKLNQIVDLFDNNNFSYVFTDQTPDFEQSFIMHLCKKRNIPFIRYLPNFMDRGYFNHYKSNGNVKTIETQLTKINNNEIKKFIEEYRNGQSSSIYSLHTDYTLYKSKKSIVKKIIDNKLADIYSFAIAKLKSFYFNKIESLLKKIYYSKFEKDVDYIYYGLALTVESHVALQSYPFINQINVIETISRSLPHGYILYVKPHPWWSSTMSLKYIRQISKMPSVKILDPNHKIKSILRNSKGIVTLNSTSGIESLVLGNGAIALAELNSYAEFHPNASYCNNLYKLPEMIVKMVNSKVQNIDTENYMFKMFEISSDVPFEADRFLSDVDAIDKANKFAVYIKSIIKNYFKNDSLI